MTDSYTIYPGMLVRLRSDMSRLRIIVFYNQARFFGAWHVFGADAGADGAVCRWCVAYREEDIHKLYVPTEPSDE